MEKLDPKTDGATTDIVKQNIEKLRELFPNAFTEGSDEDGPRWKVDFDALREILGNYIEDSQERYSFTWNGKSRARRIAQTPSTGTLRPCPEESVNWETTQNLFIEGDNLEVLKLLQKSYHKKVKMIYIDPPYNTGKEFIYPDKFQDNLDTYLRYTGQVDDEGLKLSANTESSGRYHTNWLNMMLPRLKLARNLLADDGVVFVSINETECANLRKLCEEVFGEENFVAELVWQNREGGGGSDSANFRVKHEYILAFSRQIENINVIGTPVTNIDRYTMSDEHKDERGPYYLQKLNQASIQYSSSLDYPISAPDGTRLLPAQGEKRACWRWSQKKLQWGIENDFIEFKKDRDGMWQVYTKQYLYCDNKGNSIERTNPPLGVIDDFSTTNAAKKMEVLMGPSVFSYAKPHELIAFLVDRVVSKEERAIILDFFAGSATTAHAALELNKQDGGNRKFIMVQLPEPCEEESAAYKAGYKTIADIGKERIRRVLKKLEEERAAKAKEAQDSLLKDGEVAPELDLGFKVFKLDSSNIKPWDADFDNLETALFNAVENIKPDRSEADVLYELLLKYGLDLAVPIEERKIDGKLVYIIGAGALIVCLADKISLDVVEGIAALKEELKPEVMRVVFKDSGFADDVVKTNAVQILRQAGIEDVKSL